MGLLKTLFRANPEKHEQRGDVCVRASEWGRARLAYEAALEALIKDAPGYGEARSRILEKLQGSTEALAREHVGTAQDLKESGYIQDARELLELALDLTRDPGLQQDIKVRLEGLERSMSMAAQGDPDGFEPISPVEEDEQTGGDDLETFMALCGTLPDDVRSAYLSYGPSFQEGYVALNRGDFEPAVDALSRALEENPSPDSFIPLELATALLNLHRLDEARALLESFLEYHPEALPGYQILCEVFWEVGAYDRAEALLDSCPGEFQESRGYVLLRGEGLCRAGRLGEATDFYETFIKEYGRHEAMLKALAGTYEAMGEFVRARDLYMEVMTQRQSCHARVDPVVQRKLADIRFELGEKGTAVLEAYLSLAQEDPIDRPFYFERVSRIYASMGYEEEARRFSEFARRAEEEKNQGG